MIKCLLRVRQILKLTHITIKTHYYYYYYSFKWNKLNCLSIIINDHQQQRVGFILYDQILNELIDAKRNTSKTKSQNQYYLCRKYDLLEVWNVDNNVILL